jgi:hypothetical protein
LLDNVEEILPIGGMEWEAVYMEHHARYPDKDRNPLTLKQKFYRLVCTRVPTGNPTPNTQVARALAINELILAKLKLSDGEGGDDGVARDNEDDDDGSSTLSQDPHFVLLQELVADTRTSTTTGTTVTTNESQADQDGTSSNADDVEVIEEEMCDLSISSSDKKVKKKAFSTPMLCVGSHKNATKTRTELDTTNDFLKLLMVQQMEEARVRRDELRQAREQHREMMLLFTGNHPMVGTSYSDQRGTSV